MATLDYNELFDVFWGWGIESCGFYANIALAANVQVGNNPPYTATDFLTMYPKFGGVSTPIVGTSDGTTAVLTNVSSIVGLAVGQLVAGVSIPDGSVIAAVGSTPVNTTANILNGSSNITVANATGISLNQSVSGAGIAAGAVVLNVAGNIISLSDVCTVNGNGIPVTFVSDLTITLSKVPTVAATLQMYVFTAPLLPLFAINAYIFLAFSSLAQSRYQESWTLVMALYVAHYCTLYLQGEEATPNATAGQAAQSGLALALKTAKSAGDVSVGYQVIMNDDWGQFNLTLYGQQFIQFAKIAAMGGMLVW